MPDYHVDQSDLVLPGIGRMGIRLGVNMPARENRRPPRSECDSHPEGELFCEDYDVVLYLEIIDILQDYGITKKLEHAYKSLQFDSLSIPVVRCSSQLCDALARCALPLPARHDDQSLLDAESTQIKLEFGRKYSHSFFPKSY